MEVTLKRQTVEKTGQQLISLDALSCRNSDPGHTCAWIPILEEGEEGERKGGRKEGEGRGGRKEGGAERKKEEGRRREEGGRRGEHLL